MGKVNEQAKEVGPGGPKGGLSTGVNNRAVENADGVVENGGETGGYAAPEFENDGEGGRVATGGAFPFGDPCPEDTGGEDRGGEAEVGGEDRGVGPVEEELGRSLADSLGFDDTGDGAGEGEDEQAVASEGPENRYGNPCESPRGWEGRIRKSHARSGRNPHGKAVV